MMVMGISLAFPFADNSSNPNARGPFSGLVLRGCCAAAHVTNVKAASAQMTAQQHLRYNVCRTGEIPMLDINDKAPDIKLEDENGKEVSLKDFKGKTVVLYFYPRAQTPRPHQGSLRISRYLQADAEDRGRPAGRFPGYPQGSEEIPGKIPPAVHITGRCGQEALQRLRRD